MAQTFQRIGCLDRLATNYDPTATLQCNDCCTYKVTQIVGCTDRLASNYDSRATTSCKDCCTYETYSTKPLILFNEPLIPKPELFVLEDYSSYPYDINVNDGICIRDTGWEERGWTTLKDGVYYYDSGFFLYKEQLTYNVGSNVPNWDNNGSMSQIWAAFDRLLEKLPESRVFINRTDLTPWIIPLYSIDNPLTTNPNQSKFISDCDTVKGTIYTYEEGGSSTAITLQEEIKTTRDRLENLTYEYEQYLVYIKSLEREATKAEITKLDNLKQEISLLREELGVLEKSFANATIINDTYVRNHFMACLCGTETTPAPCETRYYDRTNPEVVTYEKITKGHSECIRSLEEYITILKNQRDLGWTGWQTTFFNEFLFQSMGISVDDSKFIVENFFNSNQGYYPYNSNTLDNISGRKRSLMILDGAFKNGANFWIPAPRQFATDIINKKECCDIVGGLYKDGYYIQKDGSAVSAGVCLCEEIKKPCPTLSSGEIEIITEVIETRQGVQQITYVDVPEECCSNASLQSRMKGNFIWDGKRCVLSQEDNSNVCDTSTVITINETPIDIGRTTCIDNTVTVSAYIYFEQPENRCTNGVLVSDTSDKLTDEFLGILKNPPETMGELASFAQQTGSLSAQYDGGTQNPTPTPQKSNCCYDTETPIQGQLVIQDLNFNIINSTAIEYVDTFSSTQTNINTNTNVGQGFNKWIKLTTTIDLTAFNTSTFNIAVEFTQGLFKCCNYDIFFDDIEVGCLQPGVREIYMTEPCVGFDLSSCVIDNKKSWVYNPGTEQMSSNVYDNIVRQNGTRGMNIEQTGIIRAGGHGAINRVFAPSVDAELDFRDTDYFNLHGVIERHSKLVLNSKQLILQFNMCADDDCIIGPYGYLIDDEGNYILDDDGGRIIIEEEHIQFPNLVELERFKKTFQGFWVQIIEQFIPATTIFVAGEKWCNNRICEEKVVADYLLDARGTDLSPAPVSENIVEAPNQPDVNTSEQNTPITTSISDPNESVNIGETGSTNNVTDSGPIKVGNYQLYATDNIDPELARRTKIRSLA